MHLTFLDLDKALDLDLISCLPASRFGSHFQISLDSDKSMLKVSVYFLKIKWNVRQLEAGEKDNILIDYCHKIGKF